MGGGYVGTVSDCGLLFIVPQKAANQGRCIQPYGVCVCAYKYIYIHMYKHICIYIYICYMCISMHGYTCVRIYIYTCMSVCMYACMHTCMYVRMYIYVYTWMRTLTGDEALSGIGITTCDLGIPECVRGSAFTYIFLKKRVWLWVYLYVHIVVQIVLGSHGLHLKATLDVKSRAAEPQ